jgi:type II secretory pathway pseudopilin PulG
MTPPRNRVTPNDFNNALLAKISTRPQGAGNQSGSLAETQGAGTKKAAFTLAESATHGGRSPHSKMLRSWNFTNHGKVAFTLAEVLITLGIIGVVAAMTLPTLMQNYQKHVIQNQLKKNYAILQNWVEQAETREELPMNKWPTGANMNINEYWNVYIQPYFAQVKMCRTYKTCGYKEKLDGSRNGQSKQWSGLYWALGTDNSRVLFQLGDGTIVFLPRDSGGGYVTIFYVDVNGTAGPNTYCKDVFTFQRGTKKGIAPSGCTLELFENNWEFPKNYTYWK